MPREGFGSPGALQQEISHLIPNVFTRQFRGADSFQSALALAAKTDGRGLCGEMPGASVLGVFSGLRQRQALCRRRHLFTAKELLGNYPSQTIFPPVKYFLPFGSFAPYPNCASKFFGGILDEELGRTKNKLKQN